VIRKRTRSDYEFSDLGQELTWRLCWQHTAMLIDDRRGNCVWDISGISRQQAEQIAAGLAARHWPPDAARMPGSPRPTRRDRGMDAASSEDLAGAAVRPAGQAGGRARQ
jgi:hypothetical protein